jgi:PAS domain S-box-containing protein
MESRVVKDLSLLASIIHSSNDAILSKNLEGKINSWNRGAERMFGYSADEIIGQHLSILIPPNLTTEEELITHKIQAGETVAHYETNRISKSGKVFPVSLTISPIFDSQGAIVGASKILRDISAHKAIELKLAEESRFHRLLDNMLEGVQIMDFDWRYIYVNDNLVKQSKYKREELLGYTFMEKYPGVEATPIFARLKKCMTDRISTTFENEFIFPDGTIEYFELSIQPIPEGIFILSINTTERKFSEKKIEDLNRLLEQKVIERTAQLALTNKDLEFANSEMEAFSYSVSHDLRAPLRGIHNYTQLLQDEHQTQINEEGRNIIGIILKNSRAMSELIDDLLTFSRLGRQEISRKEIQMDTLAGEVAMEQVKANAPRIITYTIDKLPPASGDPVLIRQVWINILSNALKYTSKKSLTNIEIGSHQRDGKNVYFVKDNGIGFDMRYYHKLFGVFQRLHSNAEFEGTGVGLAITQRILQRHHGEVWAEAKPDEGAIFYFTIPFSPPEKG